MEKEKLGCFEEYLNVIDHCEDAVLVDCLWIFVGMKDMEADALKNTGNSLAWVGLFLVEAD